MQLGGSFGIFPGKTSRFNDDHEILIFCCQKIAISVSQAQTIQPRRTPVHLRDPVDTRLDGAPASSPPKLRDLHPDQLKFDQSLSKRTPAVALTLDFVCFGGSCKKCRREPGQRQVGFAPLPLHDAARGEEVLKAKKYHRVSLMSPEKGSCSIPYYRDSSSCTNQQTQTDANAGNR